MIKKGNFLKEFPFYYADTFSNPIIARFTLYSGIFSTLSLDSGLAGEIMKNIEDNNLAEKIAERGTKRPKVGELIFIETYLMYWDSIILVVLDQLPNSTDDDRIDIIEYIRNGYDMAENKGYSAIVTPGHPVIFTMFPSDIAADMHIDAIEMFLENRTSNNIKIISICIASDDDLQAFLISASNKFTKYTSWLFLKSPNAE